MHSPVHIATFFATALTALSAVVSPAQAAPSAEKAATVFKLYVESSGAYRVTFSQLAEAARAEGFELKPTAGDRLGLTHLGIGRAIWVDDGGDGRFEAGDSIELLGEHLPGNASYGSEETRFNVYRLFWNLPGTPRMKALKAEKRAGQSELRAVQHLEQDQMILRLPAEPDQPRQELWYWKKLVHLHPDPVIQDLDLQGLDRSAEGLAHFRIGLRGWSKVRRKKNPELPDHALEIHLNGEKIAEELWSSTSPHVIEIRDVPSDKLHASQNRLALKVPTRMDGDSPLIDVVMLNWIEVDYPHNGRAGSGQTAVSPVDPDLGARIYPDAELSLGDLHVYVGNGRRLVLPSDEAPQKGWGIPVPADEPARIALAPSTRLAPVPKITVDRPSSWLRPDRQADYLMISHRSLLAEVEPLADLHRERGLKVAVIDIEDVYDEAGYGIEGPDALRDFISYAYHRWQKPAPRFVLLVGDASWDRKNSWADDDRYADWTYRPWETQDFLKNQSTAYEEGSELNHRNLIPTWNFSTHQGHSASDNYFVSVDGDDDLPDLAIGRLPVVQAEEVRQIVRKIKTYLQTPPVADPKALLITNESGGLQRRSDLLAQLLEVKGIGATKVYPQSSEKSNAEHTETLLSAFDQGQLFVHFLGHGGRYIWRTGPPDPAKNHDLFSLEDLDRLQPNDQLPVVLSMTCYSAPFDHPSSDSIGEKLLRLDGRGAVAVLAASWRNSPLQRWSQVLLKHLTVPGRPIGEAIQQAKFEIKRPMFVETYNLLGDPALPIRLAEPEPSSPSSALTLTTPGLR